MAGWRDELRDYMQGAIAHQLTENSPQAPQPPWIRTPLKPHQLTLLAAATSLEAKASLDTISLAEPQLLTRYGVLADRVGAGKSLVALSMVRQPPVKQAQFTMREGGTARIIGLRHMPAVQPFREEWRDISDGAAFWKTVIPPGATRFYTGTSLIVVPHNVAQQWESYTREQTDLRAVFVRRTKDCAYDRSGWLQEVFTADVVIVSCTMLRKFVGAICFHGVGFAQIVWSRLFVDEADTIQMSLRPNEVSARFMWFITGSWLNMLFPYGIGSRNVASAPADVRALIGDGTVRGLATHANVVAQSVSDTRDARFAALVLRNTDAWIEASLLRPRIVHETVLCSAPANLGVLGGFVPPAAMEALHAGDTAGALAALGLKAIGKETVAERVTGVLRAEIVQAEKILAFKRDIEYASAAAKVAAVEKAEAKVARLREQLAALEARIGGASAAGAAACPICYDAPRTATLTPCCRQTFCLSCICECIAARPTCPLCRKAIESPRALTVIGEGGAEAEEGQEAGPPTKGAALLKLLSESTEDQRYLVFSSHEASFKGLRELLGARGIRCELLQGAAPRVERLRRQFRSGEVRVLCMNARHVGAGINLEAATHVVLYHRMNVEMERQVIGRAVRFERADELRVVHLVHESETALNGVAGSEVIVHV